LGGLRAGSASHIISHIALLFLRTFVALGKRTPRYLTREKRYVLFSNCNDRRMHYRD